MSRKDEFGRIPHTCPAVCISTFKQVWATGVKEVLTTYMQVLDIKQDRDPWGPACRELEPRPPAPDVLYHHGSESSTRSRELDARASASLHDTVTYSDPEVPRSCASVQQLYLHVQYIDLVLRATVTSLRIPSSKFPNGPILVYRNPAASACYNCRPVLKDTLQRFPRGAGVLGASTSQWKGSVEISAMKAPLLLFVALPWLCQGQICDCGGPPHCMDNGCYEPSFGENCTSTLG